MITINTNINSVLLPLANNINTFKAGDARFESILAKVAENTLEEIKTRIHEEGKAPDGSDIGKHAGTGSKVTLKATGRLENGLKVLPGNRLGWNESELSKRADEIEKRYGKTIWALSTEEEQHAIEMAQKLTDEINFA